MAYDPRDELWNSAWGGYYETYYQELLAERLLYRWQRFDDFSKLTIALTASGSAIAGWGMWDTPALRPVWILIAGTSALLTIVHKTIDITKKIHDWADSKKTFSKLRMDYQSFLDLLKIDPDFSVEEKANEYTELRDRFALAYQDITVDAFITKRIERKVQSDLNGLVLPNK